MKLIATNYLTAIVCDEVYFVLDLLACVYLHKMWYELEGFRELEHNNFFQRCQKPKRRPIGFA